MCTSWQGLVTSWLDLWTMLVLEDSRFDLRAGTHMSACLYAFAFASV
jgi:hypothetical protein